ncbi:hypothetical protein LTR70_001833 [Exophiala xenobiotica]|uniref:Uncharacterized protein n=1 Tax=Lithohypha guttulata TaxID=1690604 RepID=A0ABR0KLV3_9EURO|nr:hypothetical protein LTR24_000973 [Lithohypha guttulata]KAK5327091.1 hypothetical protein LTR70_001833 [Exophiala xenobiotica]
MPRSTMHSRLTAANLGELDTRSASHNSRSSGGSSMISPKGTRYSQGSRSFSRVSSLRPADSASQVSSRSASYARSAAPRQIEDRHSTTSHRSGSRISGGRSMHASRSANDRDDDFYDEPYARPSYSTASRYQGSQVSRSAARELPYDVEERAPGGYQYFQDLGYTGDNGAKFKHPTTKTEYEAMYGVPASKRSGAASSRVGEYRDNDGGASRVSSRHGPPSSRVGEYRDNDGGASRVSSRHSGNAPSAYSASSRSSNRDRALVRIPNVYER